MMAAADKVGVKFARIHADHLDRGLSAFTGFLTPAERTASEVTEAVWLAYLGHLIVHVSALLGLPADVVVSQLAASVQELQLKEKTPHGH